MRDAESLGHPSRDPDGPVSARRDEPIRLEGTREPVDRRLVLRRDHGPFVCESEAGCLRVAIGGNHIDVALTRRLEQPELGGSGA
jgi:hypothetical protein